MAAQWDQPRPRLPREPMVHQSEPAAGPQAASRMGGCSPMREQLGDDYQRTLRVLVFAGEKGGKAL